METLSKLKGVITSGETSGDLRTRRNELYRLMRELQERKKLQQLVSRAGTTVRGAKTVAKEPMDNWDQVSTPTGATEEECVAYLKALGVEQRLRKVGRLLFKLLLWTQYMKVSRATTAHWTGRLLGKILQDVPRNFRAANI